MKPHPRFDWRHQYDQTRDELEGQLAAQVSADPGESLTQQQFADDVDINVLVKRLGLDKVQLPAEAIDPRYYGDVSDVPDLRTVLDLANEARNKFMELPPKLRSRFNNEPAELWDFVNNPENADEAVRLGLLIKPPEPPAEQKEAPPLAEPPQTP